ncbi:uncharacterized protein MYCFIDRAFT_175999 [Pseudocercospora fijiensis CIRAD86]|uniref:Uncharacterized protein n=1 Tax=Pseudocercospora fijiensis (strain CIRAD86) TaxID=383855 RepID=M3AZ15_PSEFD|nr:uncharacterized protein MYCFIDRAFT_175999 [Pseudocercospora fijiensis CIRAD86]EME82452.1 hypothetical protein MYCFIDRAFT_175999 [Pseudocercospora fijiensis CIRAD86]
MGFGYACCCILVLCYFVSSIKMPSASPSCAFVPFRSCFYTNRFRLRLTAVRHVSPRRPGTNEALAFLINIFIHSAGVKHRHGPVMIRLVIDPPCLQSAEWLLCFRVNHSGHVFAQVSWFCAYASVASQRWKCRGKDPTYGLWRLLQGYRYCSTRHACIVISGSLLGACRNTTLTCCKCVVGDMETSFPWLIRLHMSPICFSSSRPSIAVLDPNDIKSIGYSSPAFSIALIAFGNGNGLNSCIQKFNPHIVWYPQARLRRGDISARREVLCLQVGKAKESISNRTRTRTRTRGKAWQVTTPSAINTSSSLSTIPERKSLRKEVKARPESRLKKRRSQDDMLVLQRTISRQGPNYQYLTKNAKSSVRLGSMESMLEHHKRSRECQRTILHIWAISNYNRKHKWPTTCSRSLEILESVGVWNATRALLWPEFRNLAKEREELSLARFLRVEAQTSKNQPGGG